MNTVISLLPFIAMLIICALLAISGRKEGLFFLTLPLVNIGYFSISTELFSFGKALPFDLYKEYHKGTYLYTQWIYIMHFIMVYLALETANKVAPARVRIEHTHQAGTQGLRTRMLGFPYFIICISPIIFIVLSMDFSRLLERAFYYDTSIKQFWMRFADLLFLVSAVLTPFLKSAWQRGICVILVMLFFIMLGSRAAPVMLIIYVIVERYVLQKGSLALHVLMVSAAIYILGILIYMRYMNQGGLIPFANSVFSTNVSDISDFIIFSINYMLNFSIVINARVLLSAPTDASWFFYGILPLPAFLYDLTGTYDAANRFRANIPYPGFGYAVSFLGTISYIFVVFFGFLLIGIARNKISLRRDVVERLLLYAMCFLPLLFSLQYNLRTSSRIFYMFLIIYFLVALVRRVSFRFSGATSADISLAGGRR